MTYPDQESLPIGPEYWIGPELRAPEPAWYGGPGSYTEEGPESLDVEAEQDETNVRAALVKAITGPGKTSHRIPPEFAGWTSFNIVAASAGYTQVLQRRYGRFKSKFTLTVPATTTLWVANDPSKLPQGNATTGTAFAVASGQSLPDYDAMQPVYMCFTGTGPVTVSVLDESYGELQ